LPELLPEETVVKKISCVSVLATALVAAAATNGYAQDNPLRAGAQRTYGIVKGYITRAAEKMPEEHYAFKPTKDVRSFGQLIGHIADASYGFCGAVAGEKPPMGGFEAPIEKGTTTKADLQKALAAAFAYCDKIYEATTDNTATAMVKGFWGEMPKISVLDFNTAHNFEHYGNIVTYMRLKDIVPPSSEPRK
jgi:uncharacterized damage-inducible protein DinB